MSKVNSSEYDNIDPGFLVGGSSQGGYGLAGNSSAVDGKFILAEASKNSNNGYNSVSGNKFVLAEASKNSNVNVNTNSNNYGYTTLRPEDANNNGYSSVDGDMFVSSGGNGNSENDYGYTTLPSFGGTTAYGSQGQTGSGVISMNPKALYNTALSGVDLESRVNANFQHLDDVFEELIQSVQTPELNSRLKSLYETFRKVEMIWIKIIKLLINFLKVSYKVIANMQKQLVMLLVIYHKMLELVIAVVLMIK